MQRAERECRAAMRAAADYATWREAAVELDRLNGADQWQAELASEDYDWQLIGERLRLIRRLRAAGDDRRLMRHLRQGLHWNLGNMGNPRLYQTARAGPKRQVIDYVHAVAEAIEAVSASSAIPREERRRFLAETAQAFGRSALLLSGGATLGLFHVGVVRALYGEGLLPPVLSGSSAGAVVAAVVASRADADVHELLDPGSAYYHFWRPLPAREMLRRRVLMDQAQVRRAIAANIPDLTFEDAFRQSGRVLNITVSPAGLNQPPRLLNYLTFPYLMLREAMLASAAVPFLFQPVRLATRGLDGRRQPYMPRLRWTDGSLKSDLPMLRLRRLHNVNHFIVSQTNPHVLPFMSRRAPEEARLLGAVRGYAAATVLGQVQQLARLGEASLPLAAVRRTLAGAADLLEQEYRGNITVLPRVSLWRYANVTTNPHEDAVRRFILEGERATWPRIEMVRLQTLIARTLAACQARLDRRAPRTPAAGHRNTDAA